MEIEELEKELYLKLKEKFEPTKQTTLYKYIPGKKLDTNSYEYRELHRKYQTFTNSTDIMLKVVT